MHQSKDNGEFRLRLVYRALTPGVTPEALKQICGELVSEVSRLDAALADEGIV